MVDPNKRLAHVLSRCVENEKGCLIFKGAHRGGRKHRYPNIKYNGKQWSGNRFVWTVLKGEIPPGMLACHACDDTSCLNIDHLFLGTPQDNAQDMTDKGRSKEQWKTHCRYGHSLEDAHIMKGHGGNGRQCRTCLKIWEEKNRLRRNARRCEARRGVPLEQSKYRPD